MTDEIHGLYNIEQQPIQTEEILNDINYIKIYSYWYKYLCNLDRKDIKSKIKVIPISGVQSSFLSLFAHEHVDMNIDRYL